MNPYSYTYSEPHFNLHLVQETGGWRRYTVDFATAHPTHSEENNTVRGEYLEPKTDGDIPLVILVHGLGDRSLIPCRALARSLVKNGMACFILHLVLHSSRMSPKIRREGIGALTPEEWFESYRISVIDVRQVIDWAAGCDRINREQIAVTGISFGGFISAIAMGIDRRIRAGVFLVSAGNLEKIAYLSKTLPRRWGYHRTENEFDERQEQYCRYLKQVADKGFENVDTSERGFLTDAMTFAHYLRRRPVLMINALWDEVIPKQAVLDFWAASGRPEISWFPGGHATVWLWYPFIIRRISRFLGKTFRR